MKIATLLVTCAPVALWVSLSTAAAQSATPAPPLAGQSIAGAAGPASDEDQTGIGEIIVTANRRAENQQSVPITISAFKGETLTALGVRSTVDLPQLTPGLNLTRTLAGSNTFLRGVGTTNSGYTTESPVATYIDGLYLPNAAASAFNFNNIERIEVLKGPQGTLYGRNTTGGLVQVITKDPGDVASLDVSAGYGNYDTTQLNFYGSTPIATNLAGNIAVNFTDQADGWYRNIFLNTDAFKYKDVGVQGKLKWTPGPDTKVTLRGFYDRVRSDQGNFAGVFPGSLGIDGTPYLGKGNFASRITPFVRQRQANVSLKVEQGLGFATLSSITGYIDNKSSSQSVQNGIVGQPITGQSAVNIGIPARAKTFSQELQLASNASTSKLQWIAGLFYYHDDTHVATEVYSTCVGATCAGTPVPTRTAGFQKTRSYSAYGEGTYSITSSTRLTLGLRYTRDQKSLSGLAEPLPGRPNTPASLPATAVLHPGDPFAGNPSGIDTDVNFAKLTYKAVLAQDLSSDVHLYASFNRGFKSGGFNPISFTNPPSKPETLDDYEIGVKSELFDRMLRLNVAGFYYDYRDIQLRSTAPPAPPGGSILFNAASAHIKGVDADFVFAPARGFTISGGLEYLDARYASFPGGTCVTPRPVGGAVLGGTASTPCDLTGKRPPSSPRFSYNFGPSYTFSTAIGSFTATANDGYKSSYFWDLDNRIKQKSFHLVNASVTWTANDHRFSVQVFAKNINNAYYATSGSEGTGGNDVYLPGAPRTYGATLRFHF
ncbi:MAG: hypothetical protein JWR80_4401 [Bradyrhizobium sp.]|nr:hypothetical protein [Bradyrhizobium sp.]